MNTVKFSSLIAISLFLIACGGGGSDSSPAPTPPTATTYTVSASAGTGGSISPSSRSVTSGQTTTFTVTANSGYEIDGVTGCGGSLSGNTYTTDAITGACSVDAQFKSVVQCVNPHVADYPEEFLGVHNLPVPQEVFADDIVRGISFKDYNPQYIPRGVETACTPLQYTQLMYQLSLDRIAESGATMAWLYNYGPWDDATADKLIVSEENYQISSEMVEFIVAEARKRNIDIYYSWQFTTNDIQGRTVVNLNESVTPEKLRFLLDGHRTNVINMAKFAERIGMKGMASDWNAMFIGNLYEPELEEIFIATFSEIIDRIRENFSGEVTWGQKAYILSDARIVDKVDAIHISLGGPMLSAEENEQLSPALIRDKIINQFQDIDQRYNCVHGCNYLPSTKDVPVYFEVAIQSRDNYWTEGWIEDGFCVSGETESGEKLDCIQETYVTDFSVQAIGIEGIFRAINSQQHNFSVKGVNFHTSYWHTDTLVPGEEGFPNLSQSIRGKPAEDIVRYWFKGPTKN